MGERVRIAVCNLQLGIGTTRGYWQYLITAWKYRLAHDARFIEQAADFLREEAVDVAALCEVDAGSRRTRWVDQLEVLAHRSGLVHAAFFPTRVVGARVNQGNAVCARTPVRIVRNHPLPGIGEPRFLSEAEVALAGMTVRLLVTHLSLERTLRLPQIHHIAEIVDRSQGPTILTGDFNISEQAELGLLDESHLERAASAPTFPAWRPRRYLDHLFVSKHFAVVNVYSYDDRLFSDHLPLVVELERQV